ncbi:MAG TPA: glycosyltransferase family 4 protein [Acidimicrobiales bacterium]|nr:glycosyltransferase family 4 protein [Acidimicrobiales bacterium]
MGGIQSYLWELWRRLPPDRAVVVTSSYPGDRAFDAGQPIRVERLPYRVLLPIPPVTRRVRALADAVGASLVVIDPALPLGLMGSALGRPYGVVLHGAEVSVPGRLPASSAAVRRVLDGAAHVVACGSYAASEARRLARRPVPVIEVPPGVDLDRFRPASRAERERTRAAFAVPGDARFVLGLSRLVPRKGFDVLVAAAALLAPRFPDLVVAIAGKGRDRSRLERLIAASGAPARLLGPVAHDRLPELMAAADVFAVPCRNRWGGLEQEGFGIVFLEAAACGVPQVAGASGGSGEAVADGETGVVVRRPDDPGEVAAALATLLEDADLRSLVGRAARRRAEERFDYDRLAAALDRALADAE